VGSVIFDDIAPIKPRIDPVGAGEHLGLNHRLSRRDSGQQHERPDLSRCRQKPGNRQGLPPDVAVKTQLDGAGTAGSPAVFYEPIGIVSCCSHSTMRPWPWSSSPGTYREGASSRQGLGRIPFRPVRKRTTIGQQIAQTFLVGAVNDTPSPCGFSGLRAPARR
jgi:hypothetical protein